VPDDAILSAQQPDRGNVRPGERAGGLAAGGAALTAGILAVAFNQRAAITSLPPVFPELKIAAGYSGATLAALAAVPVLCFAVFSGLAPAVARKLGEERVLGLSLVLLATGLGLRSAAPSSLLFPGTILAGGAIALMNVLVPSLIKRRRPELAGLLIGLYLMTLTAGAVLGAVIAVPVFTAGGSGETAVRLTLGMWALPALIAGLVWLPQLRTGPREPKGAVLPGLTRAHRGRGIYRHALAWQVTVFMGLQSLSYYATLSWFPTMFRDHGISPAGAGDLVALMNAGNAVTGLIVPILAQRVRDQRLLAVGAVTLIVSGLLGSAFGPNQTAVIFVCLLGLGQGSSFGLSLFLFTARAADGHVAAELSGFAQAVGYLLASAGPLLLGFLHTATGSWAIPAWALFGVAMIQLAAGVLAGRAKTIGPGPREPKGGAPPGLTSNSRKPKGGAPPGLTSAVRREGGAFRAPGGEQGERRD
jgi:MFS transporter, CP family, cyanate transporter